jgi:hypothetical protein
VADGLLDWQVLQEPSLGCPKQSGSWSFLSTKVAMVLE